MMELLSGHTIDLIYLISEHPAEKVDAMDTLIHQRTAVRCPFSSPWSLSVIALVPVPQYMDGTMGQFSEAPSFQSLSGLLYCQIEPVLMAGRYLHVLFPGTTDDLIRILNAHSHRFLNNTVDSMINTEQSDLCMKSALGSDTNQCWLHFLDHLLIIRVTCIGEMKIRVQAAEQADTFADENDLSLVTWVTFGHRKFLFTGDITEGRISELLASDEDLRADWIKMPHHGRYEANLGELLDAVEPSFAVICCSNKHPASADTLKLLDERKIQVFDTSEEAVVTTCDGEHITEVKLQNLK